jgi:hypothetical protein
MNLKQVYSNNTRSIITHDSKEFFAVCDRAKKGEFHIACLHHLKANASFKFDLNYEHSNEHQAV